MHAGLCMLFLVNGLAHAVRKFEPQPLHVTSFYKRLDTSMEDHKEKRHPSVKVRYTAADTLCDQEKAFRQKRMPKVRKLLTNFLNQQKGKKGTFKKGMSKTKEPVTIPGAAPIIGLCLSGGGFRAMILGLGCIKGLVDIGLWDSVAYCAALSGSSWGVSSWMAANSVRKPNEAVTIDDFISQLQTRLKNGLTPKLSPQLAAQAFEYCVRKIFAFQSNTITDIYGFLLANILLESLGNNRFKATLSDTHEWIQDGSVPMPIYTAIETSIKPYEWFEFSPFEIGSSYLRSYIPTSAFGRRFHNGVSSLSSMGAPAPSLGYDMGIFGSAYTASLKDVLRQAMEVILGEMKVPKDFGIPASVLNQIKSYLTFNLPYLLNSPWVQHFTETKWGDIASMRFFPTRVPNFCYHLPLCPLRELKDIYLVDAGVSGNLPVAPLLRPARNVDIIIIYDSSAYVKGAPALRAAADYAKRHKLKFPPINYEGIGKRLISVFAADDPKTPAVIYIPRIANPAYSKTFDPAQCVDQGPCSTLNFAYTPDQFKELVGLPAATIKQNEDTIRSIIKMRLASKKKR